MYQSTTREFRRAVGRYDSPLCGTRPRTFLASGLMSTPNCSEIHIEICRSNERGSRLDCGDLKARSRQYGPRIRTSVPAFALIGAPSGLAGIRSTQLPRNARITYQDENDIRLASLVECESD